MIDKVSRNSIVLGYHSPTEWVFFPEVIALYDDIVINKDIFDKVLYEGYNSASIYRSTKAELMKALLDQGILKPIIYPKGDKQKEKILEIIDYLFSNNENEMRKLLIYAYDAFIKHEQATIEKLITPDDPQWKDINVQLPRLIYTRESLKNSEPISNIQMQKNIMQKYFEDSILTPVAFKNGYNPVFQWEGYSRFEQFLMQIRKGDDKRNRNIELGSESYVLKSLSDIILPYRVIRSPDGIKKLVEKWNSFSEIRKYISDMNRQIWNMISNTDLSYGKYSKDFIGEFNYTLKNYLENINNQIQEVSKEKEKADNSIFSKITRFIIATIGSIKPYTGGIGQILDDVYSTIIKKEIIKQYSSLHAIFEYEHIISKLSLKRRHLKPIVKVGTEYQSIKYWDSI